MLISRKPIIQSPELLKTSVETAVPESACVNPPRSIQTEDVDAGHMMSLVYPDGRVTCVDLQQSFS